MNKPIRRVAVFCFVLVLALLIRANWVQGVDAASLNANPNNARVQIQRWSYPRGNIIVDGKAITQSLQVNGNKYKYKQGFTNGPLYAPVTGYDSQLYGSTGLQNLEDGILSGTDDRLFFRNTLDMLTGKQKQGGNVITTINSKVQQAAWDALGNRPVLVLSTHWPIPAPAVAFPPQISAARPPASFSRVTPPDLVTTCQYCVSGFAADPAFSRSTSGLFPLPMFASVALLCVPMTWPVSLLTIW